MARPKGSTKERVLMRDAYKASLLATAERAKAGDPGAQELFLKAVGVSGESLPDNPVKNSMVGWS